MTERFFAYILTNRPKGVLYVGLTNNLARRIWEHRTKVTPGFTSKYGVTRLVYFEEYASILEARAREQTFKHWRRGWKLKLIEDVNPTWHDLYDELILLRITLPRMRCSAQRCTADPGSSQARGEYALNSQRSRVCSAPLRAALRPGNRYSSVTRH
ncbi:MAG: GIY-YIG nuclease family protein [Xanthobacteraceae bacterium]